MKTVLLNKWHLSPLDHTASTVFIFAGGSASGRISNTWTIDFDTETWTAGPDMMVTRDVHGCAMLDSGLIVVAGGDGKSSVEILKPGSNSWTQGMYIQKL